MIPVEFDYAAPESLDEAIGLLRDGGGEAKLLAGGHSLLPLMKLRLAAPALLVDLRKVEGLGGVHSADGGIEVGAMTTHAAVAGSGEVGSRCGLLAEAAGLIADVQVRNRGTIGGSLAHGDSASDLPSVAIVTGAEVVARGSGGERAIAASELFVDYLTTSLAGDEVVTAVRFPAHPAGSGFAYEKFNRRSEDWAMVAVAALVTAEGGVCKSAAVGLTNMASRPLRATAVEQALQGQLLDADHIAQAAGAAADGTEPPEDRTASADYKRHLARVLTRRALTRAAERAGAS